VPPLPRGCARRHLRLRPEPLRPHQQAQGPQPEQGLGEPGPGRHQQQGDAALADGRHQAAGGRAGVRRPAGHHTGDGGQPQGESRLTGGGRSGGRGGQHF
jgi:hypothetical protein